MGKEEEVMTMQEIIMVGALGVAIWGVLCMALIILAMSADTIEKKMARMIEVRHIRKIQRIRLYPGVPDGALSRAQPPGEPVPTQTALSLAEKPEGEKPILVSAVEETETYETVTVSA